MSSPPGLLRRPSVSLQVAGIAAAATLVPAAIALVVSAPALGRFTTTLGGLLELLSREERPAIAEVVSSVREAGASLVLPGVLLVVIAVAGVLLARGPIAFAAREASAGREVSVRAALGRVGRRGVRLGLGRSAAVLALVIGVGIAVAYGAIAVTLPTASVETVVVRGTTLVLVSPSVAMLVAIALSALVVIVPFSLVVRARAGTAPERAPRPAPTPAAEGSAPVALLVPGAIALGILIVLGLVGAAFAAPIADDYKYFARIDDNGVVGYVLLHMQVETGRYASAFAIALAYALAGPAATQVVPVLLLVGLSVAGGLLTREFLSARGPAIALGALLGPVVALAVAPSVFDAYFWLTASLVYLPPLLLVPVAVLAIRRAERPGRVGPRRVWAAVSIVTVAISQGFNEPLALLTLIGLVGFLLAGLARPPRAEVALRAVLVVVALVGVLVLVLAPSQADRIDDTGTGNLAVAISGAFYSPLQLLQSFGAGTWLLLLGGGVAIAVVARERLRTGRGLVPLALALVTVPVPASSFISCFGTGWAAWRTYATGGALFGVGVVLLVAVAVATLPAPRPRFLLPLVASALLVVAMPPLALEASALIRAEALRASLMATRDADIAEQVASGAERVVVMPAPILVSPSDARDFEFAVEQSKDWFVPGYRAWFGIPSGTRFEYVTTPPPGYCLEGAPSPAPGILACDAIPIPDRD
jgi:hypothetical protein